MATVSYTPEEAGASPAILAALFAAEDAHFWFQARNDVLARVVRRLVRPLPAGYRVLEVGCGMGNVLRVLERECAAGQVAGLELSAAKAARARQRVRCPVTVGDLHALPGDGGHALIGMFDVLEHLPDDVRALRHLHAALAPGGRLLLTVPAHMSLWSQFDVYSGHYRRYSPASLETALRAAGFVVEQLTPFLLALLPLMWVNRRAGRADPAEMSAVEERTLAELKVRPLLGGVMRALLGWEALPLGQGWGLPGGTSLLAVARRA